MSSGALPSALAAAVLFAGATAHRITFVDRDAELRRERRVDDEVLASPGPAVLAIAGLEHRIAWSDVLWLQIVQELGKPLEGTEASYDRVERWANIAVDLDPKYFIVYYASAIHLIVYGERAQAADQLLQKARVIMPDRWELPFLLGYTAYFVHGEAAKAAELWEAAALLPDPPRFVPSLAARARYQAGDESGAIAMLESMLESLEGPHRDDVIIRLKILKSEPILAAYDRACERYRDERGSIPSDAARLQAEGYVEHGPFDLLDSKITLDENCRAHTAQIRVREDEAKKRIGSQGQNKPDFVP